MSNQAAMKLIDLWRAEARKHEDASLEEDGEAFSDEWWLHREVARVYRRCLGELSTALTSGMGK